MFISQANNIRQQRNTGISLFDTFRTRIFHKFPRVSRKTVTRNVPDVLKLFHRHSGMDNPDVLKLFHRHSAVGKPTSASVTPPIRLKIFTQGQIIITHQVSPIIVIGIDVCLP